VGNQNHGTETPHNNNNNIAFCPKQVGGRLQMKPTGTETPPREKIYSLQSLLLTINTII
jgi:hypothetical protein